MLWRHCSTEHWGSSQTSEPSHITVLCIIRSVDSVLAFVVGSTGTFLFTRPYWTTQDLFVPLACTDLGKRIFSLQLHLDRNICRVFKELLSLCSYNSIYQTSVGDALFVFVWVDLVLRFGLRGAVWHRVIVTLNVFTASLLTKCVADFWPGKSCKRECQWVVILVK